MTAREFAKEALADLSNHRNAGPAATVETLARYFASAIAAEREACARLAETWGPRPPRPGGDRARLAAAIRARVTK